jgi:DNA-binding transcriptional regulator YiaG
MRVAREPFPHPDLPGVTLHGVEVRRCTKDPEHYEVELPHMDGLHRALAGALLTKRARLTGPEIRFLRELAGWDAARLAPLCDVTPVTLSRWENDKLGHSTMADRLIRMLAAEELKLPAPRDALEHIDDTAPPSHITLRFGAGEWRVIDESDPVSVWLSFADEDREAVIKALEASIESLQVAVVYISGHGSTGPATPTPEASSKRRHEDAGRALRVAVDALRALRPPPARAPEPHIDP